MGSEILEVKNGLKLYRYKAENKKNDCTVVFIHHMWGSYKTTWRHVQLLNSLGYDCVTFDLLLGSNLKKLKWNPLLRYTHLGVFYIWTRQIRLILNGIEGDKIMYGFSGPSLSCFWAADKRNDIRKIICDGGPFHEIYKNTKKYQ